MLRESQLPFQIISQMMGVPESDRPHLGALAHRVQGCDDPDLGGEEESSGAIQDLGLRPRVPGDRDRRGIVWTWCQRSHRWLRRGL